LPLPRLPCTVASLNSLYSPGPSGGFFCSNGGSHRREGIAPFQPRGRDDSATIPARGLNTLRGAPGSATGRTTWRAVLSSRCPNRRSAAPFPRLTKLNSSPQRSVLGAPTGIQVASNAQGVRPPRPCVTPAGRHRPGREADFLLPRKRDAYIGIATSSRPDGKAGVIRGSCLCGDVKYEISGSLKDPLNCHCSMCRKHRAQLFVRELA
jgi:hypothetical protein